MAKKKNRPSEKAGDIIQDLLKGDVRKTPAVGSPYSVQLLCPFTASTEIWRPATRIIPPITPELASDMLIYMLTPQQLRVFEAKERHRLFIRAASGFWPFPAAMRFGNAAPSRDRVAAKSRRKFLTLPICILPKVMPKFCQLSRGLVLVCGVTGSGKSTTLAAMIENINCRARGAHRDDRGSHRVPVSRPQVDHQPARARFGRDRFFGEALKHVLRQDPDVILLGEMRDTWKPRRPRSRAAQNRGYLVFSTLHTTDAVQTINRIIDMYPPHPTNANSLYQLADVLKGVICQRAAAASPDGTGRVPAVEVLVCVRARAQGHC